MTCRVKHFCLALCCTFLLAFAGMGGMALAGPQEGADLPPAAKVETIRGQALLVRAGKEADNPLLLQVKAGTVILVGDYLFTGPNGELNARAISGTLVHLGPNGAMSFLHTGVPALGGKSINSLLLALGKGRCRVENKAGNAFVRTPQALFDMPGAGIALLEAEEEQSSVLVEKADNAVRFGGKPVTGGKAVLFGKAGQARVQGGGK